MSDRFILLDYSTESACDYNQDLRMFSLQTLVGFYLIEDLKVCYLSVLVPEVTVTAQHAE